VSGFFRAPNHGESGHHRTIASGDRFKKIEPPPPKKMGQSEQHLLTVTGHPKSRNKNDRFSIVKVSIAVFQLGQAAPGADGNGEMVDLP